MAPRLSNGKPRLRNGKIAITGVSSGTAQPSGPYQIGTIADYQSQRVFQRRGHSLDLTVSLSYTGAAPANVEARLVDFDSGAPVTSWGLLASLSASGGTASGKMLGAPEGCWYRLQVRDPASPQTVISGSNKFGIGMCIGLIGQSNMENAPKTAWFYPLGGKKSLFFSRPKVYNRVGRINDNLAESLNAGTYGSNFTEAAGDNGGTVNGDFVVLLANTVAAAPGIPVCLIERAVGGSFISSWQAGQTNWNAFAAAVADAGGDIEAAIWYQGESDAHNLNPTGHRAALANVHAQCAALGGRDASNFHFGVISLGPGSYGGSVEGEFGAMRALLCDYAATSPGAFLASTAHDGVTVDGVHQKGVAFARIGARAGLSLAARFGVGVSGAGPRAVSARLSGLDVLLTVQHSGGTVLKDGAGGNGAALTGFELRDASNNVITITGTAIVDATTIRVTGASAAATIAYAQMNSPHAGSSTTDPIPAAIPCDNITYVRGTWGAPLQPFTAITVTGS
jgi:hypothetical protein